MKEGLSDTIAAVSTAQGEGGVGIVRISGAQALSVALKIFRPVPVGIRERYLHLGEIRSPRGETLDRGFFVCMLGPRSYTGEDVIELHCHGGPLILKKVLSAAVSAGARLALPGEFTKRAFLNGKLDLAEAEAVSDLIRAETDLALSSARGRLEGGFSRKVASLKAPLVELLTHLEAELDFSEEEIDPLPESGIDEAIKAASAGIKRTAETFEEGRAIREGVRVLILGRPNAGKSSLLNALLQEERAIVTDVPGTTRDVIEEAVNIRGIPVRLMDTAGLREARDEAEAIGVRLARGRVAEAGLILYTVDLTGPFGEDIGFVDGLGGKKVIIVANKKDLPDAKTGEAERAFAGRPFAAVSALREEGVEALKDLIFSEAVGHGLGVSSAPPGELVASVRHRDCLDRSLEALVRASGALGSGLPRELLAADLRAAIDALGAITGETTAEDILDGIFNSFCIGK